MLKSAAAGEDVRLQFGQTLFLRDSQSFVSVSFGTTPYTVLVSDLAREFASHTEVKLATPATALIARNAPASKSPSSSNSNSNSISQPVHAAVYAAYAALPQSSAVGDSIIAVRRVWEHKTVRSAVDALRPLTVPLLDDTYGLHLGKVSGLDKPKSGELPAVTLSVRHCELACECVFDGVSLNVVLSVHLFVCVCAQLKRARINFQELSVGSEVTIDSQRTFALRLPYERKDLDMAAFEAERKRSGQLIGAYAAKRPVSPTASTSSAAASSSSSTSSTSSVLLLLACTPYLIKCHYGSPLLTPPPVIQGLLGSGVRVDPDEEEPGGGVRIGKDRPNVAQAPVREAGDKLMLRTPYGTLTVVAVKVVIASQLTQWQVIPSVTVVLKIESWTPPAL